MEAKSKYSDKKEYFQLKTENVSHNIDIYPSTTEKNCVPTKCAQITRYVVVFCGILLLISMVIFSLNKFAIQQQVSNTTDSSTLLDVVVRVDEVVPTESDALTELDALDLDEVVALELDPTELAALTELDALDLDEVPTESDGVLDELSQGKDITISNKTVILKENGTIIIES